MKKKRIWVVSEVFYPDTDIATANIATEIALKFREDFEVHVICGPQDYEQKHQSANLSALDGIHIHRWDFFNLDKNDKIKRLIRVIGISLGLFFLGFKINKEDKAFVISNPAFITPFFAFLKWLKGFEYYLLMHDVFPENLVAGGYIKESSVIYTLTQWLFIKSRKAANKIIVIGRDMKALLEQHFPANRKDDIVIIPNWADPETVFPTDIKDSTIINDLSLQDKIVILFAGNHGKLQNLLAFINIWSRSQNPNIHCIFAGGGTTKKELEQFVQDHKITNISFLPPYSRADNNKILNACHIGLVSLTDSLFGVGVPSKSYNILSAGKPILFLGNTETEIARFVNENEIGWAFEYKNHDAVILFLDQLSKASVSEILEKGERGRDVVESRYTKRYILETINDFVKKNLS